MDRFDSDEAHDAPAAFTNSLEPDLFASAERVLPDSFDEWLAQPSQTIDAPVPVQEQGIFAAILAESSAHTHGQPSHIQNRPAR